jgi:hypothetical protein
MLWHTPSEPQRYPLCGEATVATIDRLMYVSAKPSQGRRQT